MSTSPSHVYHFQFSDKFGNEVYLPYSAAMLWAYAKSLPDVDQAYRNMGFTFLRERPEDVVDRLEDPRVAAFSTYVWSFEISAAVARALKERHPSCVVVFGGPHVPCQIDGFFDRHPYIDVAVHGEGEITYGELLRELAQPVPDLTKVAGISTKRATNPPRPRLRDLAVLPSPYLTGVLEALFSLPYRFNAVWETNRGCPYQCTFCDWGGAIGQKMSMFDEERLLREIEYFGEREITHVYCGDANFGIVERDVDLARTLSATKARMGYPQKFRVNYAKNSTQRVFDIARVLHEVELDKGITLSVQSMDETTLRTIKRRNLKYDSLSGFMRQYQAAGIPTYSEVILGLPGETYESFRTGIDTLLAAGAHDSLYIYRCSVLPNAEMNDPDFRRTHAIETVRVPFFLMHARPGEEIVAEYEDSVVATATLPRDKYQRCVTLAWAIQAFHALNLTRVMAVYACVSKGMEYSTFYEELLAFAERNPETLIGTELTRFKKTQEDFLAGRMKHLILDDMPELSWTPEEVSYLNFSFRLDRFYEEVDRFLAQLDERGVLAIDPGLRADLIRYQRAIVVKWDRVGDDKIELGHSVHRFYRAALAAAHPTLAPGKFDVTVRDEHRFQGDKARYATEIVFWGRRGGKFVYQDVEEREHPRLVAEAIGRSV